MANAPLRKLGTSNGPSVTPVGLGLMAIGAHYGSAPSQEEVDKLLDRAFEVGSLYWDTSDAYGDSQQKIGNWFKKNPGKRDKVFLSTKWGYYRLGEGHWSGACSDPSYVPQALDACLAALQTDYLDMFTQHRVDPKVPIEIVLESLRPALESGKVRWIGLSECSLDTLRRAKAVPGLGEKVITIQMEFSPFTLDLELNGMADLCKELGVSVVAYSPLARGMMTGRFRSRADFEPSDGRLTLPRFSEENFPKNLLIVDRVKSIADRIGATPAQVTLAWILAEHPNWIVIPGARSPERVEENVKGGEIKLSPEDVASIRKLVDNAEIGGKRYMDALMGETQGDCISPAEWKKA